MSGLLATFMLVASLPAASVSADIAIGDVPHHPGSSSDRPPAIKGNPAFDPNLPMRIGQPGQLLLRCRQADDGAIADLYSSAVDFDDGRQSFFLRQRDGTGKEVVYPAHGFFLDGGASGVFMIHDGKGIKEGSAYRIDQSVNMGVLLLRTTNSMGGGPVLLDPPPEPTSGLRAILDVFAEDGGDRGVGAGQSLAEYSCRWEKARHLNSPGNHVRVQPNSGATPPSHWYGESDRTLITCQAIAPPHPGRAQTRPFPLAPAHPKPAETGSFPSSPAGEYRIELRVAKIWPGHLGFLVVRTPGQDQPIGYNVHMLEGPGRLLIHAHSYPHRTRIRMMDTMEETETVIGGLLLVPTKTGYTGWIGLAGASADPYNITFSWEATVGDYAAQGRIVVPPLPVTCASPPS